MAGYVCTTGNADVNAPHLHFVVFGLTPEAVMEGPNRSVSTSATLMSRRPHVRGDDVVIDATVDPYPLLWP